MGFLGLRDLLRSPAGNYISAFVPAFGTEVEHIIGRFYHVEVMFHDQDRITREDELVDHFEQLLDVLGMEPDRRLIEDVEYVLPAFPP